MSLAITELNTYLRLFIICGLSTLMTYVIALFVPLPSLRSSYLVFMAFGPFFCVSMFPRLRVKDTSRRLVIPGLKAFHQANRPVNP